MKAQRTPIVVGNWKMQGNLADNRLRLSLLLKSHTAMHGRVEAVICPTYLHLPQTTEALAGSDFHWGAQTVSEYVNGAVTGDISAEMLQEFGCRYCIIGHSERRGYFHESAQQISEKFLRLTEVGITPIVCVGEPLAVRESGRAEAYIVEQIQALADFISLERLAATVLAYEPIWAIGTGKTATPEQAQPMHQLIRSTLGKGGESTRILYGGSVKADNAASLFAQPDIDGALVGGASLDASGFIDIVSAAHEAETEPLAQRFG